MEKDFLKDLKWSIEETDRKGTHKSSKFYKPSSLHCIRNMFYQRIGADVENDDTSYTLIGICNSGTDIHVRIQQAVEGMRKNNIDCDYIDVETYIKDNNLTNVEVVSKEGMETKLRCPELNMVFLCDGIIKYKGKYYILEIKTETSRKFQTRFDVADEHKNQARAYSLTLGIDEVLFLYVCRDNLDMKTFTYSPSGCEKLSVVSLITTCEGFVKKEQTPPKPEDTANLKCEYCKYKKRCNNE